MIVIGCSVERNIQGKTVISTSNKKVVFSDLFPGEKRNHKKLGLFKIRWFYRLEAQYISIVKTWNKYCPLLGGTTE